MGYSRLVQSSKGRWNVVDGQVGYWELFGGRVFSRLIVLLISFGFVFSICPTYLFLQLDTGFRSVQSFRGTRGVIHPSLLAQAWSITKHIQTCTGGQQKNKDNMEQDSTLLLKCAIRLRLTLTKTFLHLTGLCYMHPILKCMGNESTCSFILG